MNHLLPIQSRVEEIRRYNFHILHIFGVPVEILFIPVCYELDRLLDSKTRTNFMFVQNRFGLYDSFFLLINGICIYIKNLPLEVYPFHFLLALFLWG